MTIDDARKLHQEVCDRLFDLVLKRNELLRRLDLMSGLVRAVTPAMGMVIEFNTGLARQLLDEIDLLTPRISAGIEEVNEYAEKIGQPAIHWHSLDLRSDG